MNDAINSRRVEELKYDLDAARRENEQLRSQLEEERSSRRTEDAGIREQLAELWETVEQLRTDVTAIGRKVGM